MMRQERLASDGLPDFGDGGMLGFTPYSNGHREIRDRVSIVARFADVYRGC